MKFIFRKSGSRESRPALDPFKGESSVLRKYCGRSSYRFETGALSICLLTLLIASCGGGGTGPSPDDSNLGFVSKSGQVFSSVSSVGPCKIAPGVPSAPIECYSNPVAAAVVSTSIDSATATTDAAGRFLLVTNMSKERFRGCQSYTLTITAAGHPTYNVTGPHGTDGGIPALYSLSPPEPSIVRGTGCT